MATRLKPLRVGEASNPAESQVIQFSKDGFGNHFDITMRVDTDADSSYPHHLAYAEAKAL